MSAGGAAAAQDPQAANRFISEYRIGPQDELDIKVAKGDLYNIKARVSEKGTISIPFLGEIMADGLTAAELEKALAKALIDKQQMLDPQVSVTITDRKSKRVTVIGAVQTPGSYELLGRQTLLQILSTAGGLSRDAGREILIIRRLPDGTSTSLMMPPLAQLIRRTVGFIMPIWSAPTMFSVVGLRGTCMVMKSASRKIVVTYPSPGGPTARRLCAASGS